MYIPLSFEAYYSVRTETAKSMDQVSRQNVIGHNSLYNITVGEEAVWRLFLFVLKAPSWPNTMHVGDTVLVLNSPWDY